MPFKPGTPKPPNSGRKKGVPNSFTTSMKEAFRIAFDEMGGAQALAEWGKLNPDRFYPLASKLIPIDVTSGDKPIAPSTIRVELVAANADTDTES